jgi:1-acyl-sn-glycerol-3-phosphate acyltransferase
MVREKSEDIIEELSEQEQKHSDRIKLLEKIEDLERDGNFDCDADLNENPPSPVLMPDQIDYLRKDFSSKFKNKLLTAIAENFYDRLIDNKQVIIKEVKGIENLENISTGGIITSNHFNAFECFSVIRTFENTKVGKKHKLYKVIREGNYTNFPGFYGMIFKYCDTLPLSSNHQTMKKFYSAVETILKRGDFILIYPEQTLWWNYQKPKPLKDGAYKFAVKNNVPIIPFFITTKESEVMDDAGFPIMEYYIHIEKPIYKKEDLTEKENVKYMKIENYRVWKNIYESFYNKKLEYTCEPEKLPDYVLEEIGIEYEKK